MLSEDKIQVLKSIIKLRGIDKIQEALGANSLYLVGGCLRDLLLDKEISDIDCTTALSPDEIIFYLKNKNIHYIPTGLKHQTITVVPIENLAGIEITSFHGPNMNPKGGLSLSQSIQEDLKFRDFSINAIALSVDKNELFFEEKSLEDIQQKIVRAVGIAEERFKEDPLRVLRMIRFSCAKNFEIEEKTLKAANNFLKELSYVSIERVRDEIIKILISHQPHKGFYLLAELGILKTFIPELDKARGFEQNEYHQDDVFVHTMKVLEKTPPDLVLRLAALLHDIGKPETLSIDPETNFRHFYKHESVGVDISRNILKRLKFSNAIIDDVCVLVATHMRPLDAGLGGLRRLLRDTNELFPKWRILKQVDSESTRMNPSELKNKLELFDKNMEEVLKGPAVSPLKNLAIKGEDLINLGLEPSPLFKEILHHLHELVLDNPELNNKDDLIKLAKKYLIALKKKRS